MPTSRPATIAPTTATMLLLIVPNINQASIPAVISVSNFHRKKIFLKSFGNLINVTAKEM